MDKTEALDGLLDRLVANYDTKAAQAIRDAFAELREELAETRHQLTIARSAANEAIAERDARVTVGRVREMLAFAYYVGILFDKWDTMSLVTVRADQVREELTDCDFDVYGTADAILREHGIGDDDD